MLLAFLALPSKVIPAVSQDSKSFINFQNDLCDECYFFFSVMCPHSLNIKLMSTFFLLCQSTFKKDQATTGVVKRSHSTIQWSEQ